GGFALVTLPLYALAGAFASHVDAKLEAADGQDTTDLTRRYVVRSLTLGGAGIVVGVFSLGRLLYRRPDPGSRRLVLAHVSGVEPRASSPGDAAFAHIPGLTPQVTPTSQFY